MPPRRPGAAPERGPGLEQLVQAVLQSTNGNVQQDLAQAARCVAHALDLGVTFLVETSTRLGEQNRDYEARRQQQADRIRELTEQLRSAIAACARAETEVSELRARLEEASVQADV